MLQQQGGDPLISHLWERGRKPDTGGGTSTEAMGRCQRTDRKLMFFGFWTYGFMENPTMAERESLQETNVGSGLDGRIRR